MLTYFSVFRFKTDKLITAVIVIFQNLADMCRNLEQIVQGCIGINQIRICEVQKLLRCCLLELLCHLSKYFSSFKTSHLAFLLC